MRYEDSIKYSLQLTTLESVSDYSKRKGLSFRQASFLAFSNLQKSLDVDCGFNLKSPLQFYHSLKRFKSSKMNHLSKKLSQ
jgi:hypothetical protein